MTWDATPTDWTTVLVVDDDPDARRALAMSLRRLGCLVESPDGPLAALEHAERARPDLIFLDLRMPQMDGHTFLKRLQADGVDSSVIMISGFGTMVDVVELVRLGAVDYLAKPFSQAELAAAVQRALAKRSGRRSAPDSETAPPRPAPTLTPGAMPIARATGIVPRAAGADPTFQNLAAQVRRGDITIPPVPAILAQVRVVVARPDSSAADLAAPIERDPKLVAQVLRLANSAQFAHASRTTDVRAAVSRLGFRQIAGMIETIMLDATFRVGNPALRALHGRIWRYAVARAIAMRSLAEVAMARDRGALDAAYLAGLLADVGALFILWLCNEKATAGTLTPEALDAALRLIRDEHHDLGASLLERWAMHRTQVQIARMHHVLTPPTPPEPVWQLAVVGAALADLVVAGDDVTRAEVAGADLVDRCRSELGLGEGVLVRVAERVEKEYVEVIAAFGGS